MPMSLNDFFAKNALSIIIAVVGVISSYAIYGYKLTALEAQVVENKETIAELENQNVDVQVQLAQIATDIQYIKANIERILK